MLKFRDFIRNNYVIIVLLFIIAVAFFLRTYHFEEWLYFKMDQARDASLINNVVENGSGYLPLLGPRAGATELSHGFLRLGPIFYYFQYISAIAFQSTEPYVLAYPELFFSIAVIPLLYFFARLYFSRPHALLLTAMYSFSFLIIQYSRFSWNPNSLQFFIILSFYGLLRLLNEPHGRRAYGWLILWVMGITIGSQLHFFGFFSLVGISGLLLAFHLEIWKKDKLRSYFKKDALIIFSKYLAVAFLVFMFFYTPVIISEVMERGQNTRNFIEAFGAKPSAKPFTEKILKNLDENLRYYCLITTSECYTGNTKNNLLPIAGTAMIILGGLRLSFLGLRKIKKGIRRDFLALLLVWVGVFSVLTIPIAFQLRPRFFIIVFAVPFICLTLLYEFLEQRYGKRGWSLALLFSMGIVILNMRGTIAWFREQADSQKGPIAIERTLILKVKDGVTLGQLTRVADWISVRHRKDFRLYYYVKPELIRPMNYLLSMRDDDNLQLYTMKINKDPKAQYFAITAAKSGAKRINSKFGTDYSIIDSMQIGQLMVYEISFNNREISDTFMLQNRDGGKDDRLYWKDLFRN